MAARAPPVTFSEAEQRVLLCVLDAMWPDLGAEAAERLVEARRAGGDIGEEEAEALRAYARRPASGCRDLVQAISVKVGFMPPKTIVELHLLLKSLASPIGCLALTGRRGPLYRLSTAAVQAVVLSWSTAPLVQVRDIGKSFKLLAAYVCMGASPGEVCASWSAMGYPVPDLAAMRDAVCASSSAADFDDCRVSPEKPLGMAAGALPEVLCDCVVVGSGPGGAMVTAELAEAGFSVALLESGSWVAPREQKLSEQDAFRNLYQEAGNFFSEDRNFTVLAGAAFGGGGTVNWNCCLPPPEKVREEWARDFGVEWAATEKMTESVEGARDRLAMHTEAVRHNGANEVLLRGCERLGYQVETAAQQGYEPQSPDNGGWCSAGWKHGHRQGMHGSALADAAKAGGLRLLDGCTAREVLRDAEGRACAVRAVLRRGGSEAEVVVRGRAVVAAGGSLQTPLLLRRSGLRNRHIGRHLCLHPAMTIFGRFEERVNFFRGAPMTAVSRVVEDLDGKGYGAKIWCPNFHPITWGALMPWQGAEQYKSALALYAHSAPLISLVRDHGEGKVWEGSDERAHVSYSFKAGDKAHLLEAVERSARILVAAGAREVHSAHNAVEPLVLSGEATEDPARLEAWLARLRAAGLPENGCSLGSAHQMSTCRMAASPKLGAVRPSGETWEVPGLFVADTSAFPTASGVNPMWTCAAIAHRVAQNLKAHLRETAPPEPAAPVLRRGAGRRVVAPCCGTAAAGAPVKPPTEAVERVGSDTSTEATSEPSPPIEQS